MNKYTYEEYIKNECHPVGFNEACESYYFAQSTVDILLDRINSLEEQLKNAIVPRFKVGQEIWDIHSKMYWKVNKFELNEQCWEIYRLGHDGTDDYSCCIMPHDKDTFFATREEAEKRLAELEGK